MPPRPFKRTVTPAHKRMPDYKTGRPTLYRPEYCDMVIEHMGKGHSLTAFAGLIRVNVDTIYEWQARRPDFSEAVTIGRAARVNALEHRAFNVKNGGEAAIAIFALKNADPNEYAEVRKLTVEHNVTARQMTTEQLREIVARRHAPLIEHDSEEDEKT